jgi:peptidoglycan/LPS O-acetylase OafA/YrhL
MSSGPAGITRSSDKSVSGVLISGSPENQHHFGLLDDWRGIAIILVFLRHCENAFSQPLQDSFVHAPEFLLSALSGKVSGQDLFTFLFFYPWHLGWVALPIFFVVSGFCIHLSYAQSSRPDLKKFFIRRFFRIYPPYLLALLFFAVIFPVSRLPFTKLTYWGDLVTHLFICHNISELSVCAIVPSYWTIAVEVQLYLLFPLVIFYVRRYSFGRVLVVLGIIELSLHAFGLVAFGLPGGLFLPVWIRAAPYFYWFSWAIGAAIADAYLTGKPLPFTQIHPVVWLLAALVAESFPLESFSFPFFALAIASMISRGIRASREGQRRGPYLGRGIRMIGVYSYSIYLIHDPILRGVVGLYEERFPGIDNHSFAVFAAGVSSALIVFPIGILMYHLVERPSISCGKKLLSLWARRLANQEGAQVVPAA